MLCYVMSVMSRHIALHYIILYHNYLRGIVCILKANDKLNKYKFLIINCKNLLIEVVFVINECNVFIYFLNCILKDIKNFLGTY